MQKMFFICLVFSLAVSLSAETACATTDYARQTGFQCGECHIESTGAGPLTKAGRQYMDGLKIKGLYRPLTQVQKVVRFFIGYIHLLVSVAWFGTIIYVHILLKPAYASKGLPRGELILGLASIVILAVTGTLLTISRIPSWEALYTTRFGILLSIKIVLFLIMVSTAVIVTTYIGPRMRARRKDKAAIGVPGEKRDFTLEELHSFDGLEGRPAYIVLNGTIYDVTGSRAWKNGSHLKKHLAGHDLTDALKIAPHKDDKVLKMPRVGNLIESTQKPATPFYERLFFFFAYMNLVLVFLIIFVIALWRWG